MEQTHAAVEAKSIDKKKKKLDNTCVLEKKRERERRKRTFKIFLKESLNVLDIFSLLWMLLGSSQCTIGPIFFFFLVGFRAMRIFDIFPRGTRSVSVFSRLQVMR